MTIVAAWMRAETGVGPAIASGSQTYSGSWADFPQAPTNSPRSAKVMAHWKVRPANRPPWITAPGSIARAAAVSSE